MKKIEKFVHPVALRKLLVINEVAFVRGNVTNTVPLINSFIRVFLKKGLLAFDNNK